MYCHNSCVGRQRSGLINICAQTTYPKWPMLLLCIGDCTKSQFYRIFIHGNFGFVNNRVKTIVLYKVLHLLVMDTEWLFSFVFNYIEVDDTC